MSVPVNHSSTDSTDGKRNNTPANHCDFCSVIPVIKFSLELKQVKYEYLK